MPLLGGATTDTGDGRIGLRVSRLGTPPQARLAQDAVHKCSLGALAAPNEREECTRAQHIGEP